MFFPLVVENTHAAVYAVHVHVYSNYHSVFLKGMHMYFHVVTCREGGPSQLVRTQQAHFPRQPLGALRPRKELGRLLGEWSSSQLCSHTLSCLEE